MLSIMFGPNISEFLILCAGVGSFFLFYRGSTRFLSRIKQTLYNKDVKGRTRVIRFLKAISAWLPQPARLQGVEILGALLHDPVPAIQQDALAALGWTSQLEAIHLLLEALGEPDLHYTASKAMDSLAVWVYVVSFGETPVARRKQEFTLLNPDVSHLDVPLPSIRTIRIDADRCEHRLISTFLEYLEQHLDPLYLHKHVMCEVNGSISRMACLNPLAHCKKLTIKNDTIVFGDDTAHHSRPGTTLYNPDFSNCLVPLSRLKRLIVYPEASSFHQLEYFLTYAVNHIGQKHLKQQVDVVLCGAPDTLHPNLRNSLSHICRQVYREESTPH